MKIKGMLRMLAAAAAIAIGVAGNAGAQQGNRGSGQQKYTDDAIVRDLKAGKLTVREAQILQDRRDHAETKTTPKATVPAEASKPGAKKAHAAKPVKPGKAVKAGKKKSQAPVRHLTSPHAKHGQHAPKGKAAAKPQHAAAVKDEPGKASGPARKKDKTATKKPEPVRKTAVKYIR